MPNRILKESICTSDEIESLSPEQEVFFYRLMVVCDDHGLMDARPSIIKARCYPLKSIDSECIQALLIALNGFGLIELYSVEGKPYLHIKNWQKHQQIRAKRAKYPMPSDGPAIIGNQLLSDAPVIQSNPIQSNPTTTTDVVVGQQSRDQQKEVPEKSKRKTRLADDFTPNETGMAYAAQRGLVAGVELEAFKNFHASKGTLFFDWQAGWRTWCDKAVEFGRGSAAKSSIAPKRKPTPDNFDSIDYGKGGLL